MQAAELYFKSLDPAQKTKLSDTITMGLPGRTSAVYDLKSFKQALAEYEDIDESVAR